MGRSVRLKNRGFFWDALEGLKLPGHYFLQVDGRRQTSAWGQRVRKDGKTVLIIPKVREKSICSFLFP